MVNYKVLIAMLLVAVFAVGAVSATEDIAIEDNIIEPADDIVVDDVSVEDDVEIEDITADNENQGARPSYDVDETTTDIQAVINTKETTTHVVSFKPITYTNVGLTIHGNVTLMGNGATLIGGGNNIFTIAGANNFTITGFNIITNSTSKAAVYGANVFNANIINNNITGGKDGINIMQTYDNVTIDGNRITGVVRDAISLVDHRTLSDTDWINRGKTYITNNIITGSSEYGIFIGGNFKGVICNNTITNVDCGIEFSGKKAATNGRLNVTMCNNNISNVINGIY